ncbi:MAG TPA: GNAT family N-acetyltransferase, partial [Flavobacterium sp.]|nr:GNAT family N-acetyltransferase [Flavobacterium sp.]
KQEFENIALINNDDEERFEFVIDGLTAIVEYKVKGNDIYLTHTEVPQALEGRGIAAALVEKVLLEINKRGQQVVPLCPYVQSFLKRHPEWERIVKSDPS